MTDHPEDSERVDVSGEAKKGHAEGKDAARAVSSVGSTSGTGVIADSDPATEAESSRQLHPQSPMSPAADVSPNALLAAHESGQALSRTRYGELVDSLASQLREAEVERDRLREGVERVSTYTFFPDDDPRQDHDAITVQRVYWAGWPERDAAHPHPSGEWAIRFMGRRFNRDGEWEWEPQPSSRDDDFYARTCFTRDDALARVDAARSALSPQEGET